MNFNRIKWMIIIIAVSTGLSLLGISFLIHSEFLKSLGDAFLVASIVGTLFELAFHGVVIGDSMNALKIDMKGISTELDSKVKGKLDDLHGTISNMNNVLKGADELNITDLYHRIGHKGIEEWRNDITQIIDKAEDFIFISGKTLEIILNQSDSIKDLFIKKLSSSNLTEVKFLIADPYTENSAFRKECNRSTGRGKSYNQTKNALTWLYFLKYDEKQTLKPEARKKLCIKIFSDNLPFMSIITEKHLLVQHYLPYQDNKTGIFMKIENPKNDTTNLYGLYLDSFKQMFKNIEDKELGRAIEAYIRRKADKKRIIDEYIPRAAIEALGITIPQDTR